MPRRADDESGRSVEDDGRSTAVRVARQPGSAGELPNGLAARHAAYAALAWSLRHDPSVPESLRAIRFFDAAACITGPGGLGLIQRHGLLGTFVRRWIAGNGCVAHLDAIGAKLYAFNLAVVARLLVDSRRGAKEASIGTGREHSGSWPARAVASDDVTPTPLPMTAGTAGSARAVDSRRGVKEASIGTGREHSGSWPARAVASDDVTPTPLPMTAGTAGSARAIGSGTNDARFCARAFDAEMVACEQRLVDDYLRTAAVGTEAASAMERLFALAGHPLWGRVAGVDGALRRAIRRSRSRTADHPGASFLDSAHRIVVGRALVDAMRSRAEANERPRRGHAPDARP